MPLATMNLTHGLLLMVSLRGKITGTHQVSSMRQNGIFALGV